MTRKIAVIGIALLVGAFAVACSKAPAEAALKAADAAVQAAQPEAQKFVPDQFKEVSDALTEARAKFDSGDYAAALAAAKDIPAKASAVADAAKAKKDEMTKSWTELENSMPAMLESVQKKVEELGKTRRLPKGLDKARLEEMTAALPTLSASWTEAMASATAGDFPDALKKAGEVKTSVEGMMTTLGLEPPAPAAAPAEPTT